MTTQTYTLPSNSRRKYGIGFDLTFYEATLPGECKKTCLVYVRDESGGIPLTDLHEFSSWDHMKQEYPTLLDFLKNLAKDEKWSAAWEGWDRIYYIESIAGGQSIYDCSEVVWFDGKDNA